MPTSLDPGVSSLCFVISLEGKDGVKKCVRIPFDAEHHSYESIKQTILERYLPDEDKPFNDSDYDVKLREIREKGRDIDIENTGDIDLAMNTPYAKTTGHIEMTAFIRPISEPPIIMQDAEIATASASATAAASKPPALIATGESFDNINAKRKVVSPVKKTPTKKRKTTKNVTTIDGGAKLSVTERIIRSLAEMRALGKANPPRIQVALFSGYSNVASKGFTNALSSLKTQGLVAYPDKKSVSLTEKGLETEEAKGISPPKDNNEVHMRIKALLTPKQAQIFDLLAENGMMPHPRDETAAAVGYSNPASKGWSNAIGKMSSIGIVQYPKDDSDPKKKWIQLTEMCFPFSNSRLAADVDAFRAPTPSMDSSLTPPLESPIMPLSPPLATSSLAPSMTSSAQLQFQMTNI